MNTEQQQLLRAFLDRRDPGMAPVSLRTAAMHVPYTTRPALFPSLEQLLARLSGSAAVVRPTVLLFVLLATVLAIVSAAVYLRNHPSPPRGLIAYTVALGQATGSTGIRLIAADGTGGREVTSVADNILEHSPRWSADGRTLLFAHVSRLDPSPNFCAGVGSIVLYDVAMAEERVVAGDLRPIALVEWSPSGDEIAFIQPARGCFGTGHLGVLDLASGRITESTLDAAVIRELGWIAGSPSVWSLGTCIEPDGFLRPCEKWVPSYDGRLEADSSDVLRDVGHRLVIRDLQTGAQINLGRGVGAAWSPDSTAIAFMQPIDQGAPSNGEPPLVQRAKLAIAVVGTWQVRLVKDVVIEVGYAAPAIRWTLDGKALYWKDSNGGHVVDVETGHENDLPPALDRATDLQWQPTP